MEASGFTVEKRGGKHWGKVTLPDGTRPRIPLGDVGEMSDERAREKVRALVERGRADGNLDELVARIREKAGLKGREDAPPAPAAGPTVGKLAEDWWTGGLYRKHGAVAGLKIKKSAKSDEYRFKGIADVVVRPGVTFGALQVVDVREEDVDAVFATLPPEWRPDTRQQVYAMLHRLFDLAIVPCRLRKDNPVGKHLRAAKGDGLLFQFMHPGEVLAALRVDAERAPLGLRVCLAFKVYTGLRKGTLDKLRWRDLDLDRGRVRALHTKTGQPLVFAMEFPGLLHVMKGWHAARGRPDGAEFVWRGRQDLGVGWDQLARAFREMLRAGGVTRAELFDGDNPQSVPLRAHDARATFVTWCHRAEKSRSFITDRTGHIDEAMVARYTRAAREFEDLDVGAPFPDLTRAIPELDPGPPVPPSGPVVPPGPSVSPAPRNNDLRTESDRDGDDAAARSPISEHPRSIVDPVVAGSIPVTHPALSSSDHTSMGQPWDSRPAESRAVAPVAGLEVAVDVVEDALAAALGRASAAGEWSVVSQLARELEARRLARAAAPASNVVPLDRGRTRGAT